MERLSPKLGHTTHVPCINHLGTILVLQAAPVRMGFLENRPTGYAHHSCLLLDAMQCCSNRYNSCEPQPRRAHHRLAPCLQINRSPAARLTV